ncbi:hypothetical protein [Photobacterium damselae]|uniref:hypothetical protein n=1 Tax=Photobacterium damselae TaxID=38293 RepID=UPI004068F2D2
MLTCNPNVYDVLYDINEQAQLNINSVIDSCLSDTLLQRLVYTEKSRIRAAESTLFPLECYRIASRHFVREAELERNSLDVISDVLVQFWHSVCEHCEWLNEYTTSKDKRQHSVLNLPNILKAIGLAGGIVYRQQKNLVQFMAALSSDEWLRATKKWSSVSMMMRDDPCLFIRVVKLTLVKLSNGLIESEDQLFFAMVQDLPDLMWGLIENSGIQDLVQSVSDKLNVPLPKLTN